MPSTAAMSGLLLQQHIESPISRLSVAIIDDDIVQLSFLKAQFAQLGAVVTTFASGLDFLNKGCNVQEKDARWDLVVVDYLMPVLNGIETIASFTSEMLSNTKVCLLSGSNLEDEGQSFLDDLGLTSFRKAPDAYRDIWQELSSLPVPKHDSSPAPSSNASDASFSPGEQAPSPNSATSPHTGSTSTTRSRSNPRWRQYDGNNPKKSTCSHASPTSVPVLPPLQPTKNQLPIVTEMPRASTPKTPKIQTARTVNAKTPRSAKVTQPQQDQVMQSPPQSPPQAPPPPPKAPSQVQLSTAEKASLKKILMTTKLFSGLNNSQLERVLDAGSFDWIVPGRVITKEGDNWPYFCAIITGKVQVSRSDKGILGEMEAGKWFGHFLRSPVAMATVLSLQKTLIAKISSNDFDVACRPQPEDEGAWNRKSDAGNSSESPCAETGSASNSAIYANLSMDDVKFDTRMIGNGSFAQVYRCMTQDGKVHAIKCTSKSTVVKHGAEKQMINEVALLSVMDHQFIVHLDKVVQDRYCIYLLMEYVPGGEFFKYLQVRGTISEGEAQFYMVNVAIGLEYMHSQNVIFRDLKPENLVLSAEGYLKMVDLGFSKKINGMTFTLCGTPDYIAPEIVANKGHGRAVDYWSLGILLYEMLTAKTPYSDAGGNVYKIYEQIMNGRLTFPARPRLGSDARAFIGSLLLINPKRRLGGQDGVNDLRGHQWLKYADWDGVRDCKVQAPHIPASRDTPNCTSNYDDLIATMTHTRICDSWNPVL